MLALTIRNDDGKTEILVLAITHHAPARPADAVALPASVKSRLGLDDDASWIVTTEANAFVWPGPDLRPIPGKRPASVTYGRVPEKLLQEAARSFLANRKRQRTAIVSRTG